MRKRILAVLMPVLLVCLLTAQAVCAADLRASVSPSLTFDGTTAVCTVTCRGNSTSDQLEATLTLYQGSTYVDSWSGSGKGRLSISGECAARSGKTYQLELTYSINGVEKPSVSVTKTCP